MPNIIAPCYGDKNQRNLKVLSPLITSNFFSFNCNQQNTVCFASICVFHDEGLCILSSFQTKRDRELSLHVFSSFATKTVFRDEIQKTHGSVTQKLVLCLMLFLALWENYFGRIYFNNEIRTCLDIQLEKNNIFFQNIMQMSRQPINFFCYY